MASLSRVVVPALDSILGKRLTVLDDGFVRVVDYMGDDTAVVQAARISYGEGAKRKRSDRGLIRYLMRHRHTSPFEMCEIKLHVRVPMDCWRQWIRHRTANVNEYSTRYSESIDAAMVTAPNAWRAQATTNRQGSAELLPSSVGKPLSLEERDLQSMARRVYESRLEAGVAREQARKDLPLSTCTEAYWKIDLHNLLHFLALRLDATAQLEIRSYATVIAEQIVAIWCPLVWEAFREYRLKAIMFSGIEQRILAALMRSDLSAAIALAKAEGWLGVDGQGLKAHRERIEFESKLETLGVLPPW